MKSSVAFLSVVCLSLLCGNLMAQNSKIDVEEAKDALKKLLGEVSDAAEKATKKSEAKGNEFWERSKDNLVMEREAYSKKVGVAMARMDAELKGLEVSDASISARVYFKVRVESLKQHLQFCREDFERLKATATEEEFRARQRNFDRTVAFLGDQLSLTLKEAGL